MNPTVESATVSEGLKDAAPAMPPTEEPYTLTLHATLLVHATTMRTLDTGAGVEGDDVDTNAVAEVTSGAGQAAAVQRRICVPRFVRRTS